VSAAGRLRYRRAWRHAGRGGHGDADIVTLLWRRVDPATNGAKREEAGARFSRMWPQIALTGFAALLLPSALCVALGVVWQRP